MTSKFVGQDTSLLREVSSRTMLVYEREDVDDCTV